MNIRKNLARKGIKAAYKAARTLGLGQIGTSLLVGAGSALGAATPYVAGATALRLMGFKKLSGMVSILGSFDLTGMEVALDEGDKLDPDYNEWGFGLSKPHQDLVGWYEALVENAYREERG